MAIKWSINSVVLVGRLTRDPEIRVEAKSQKIEARFCLALDRLPDAAGSKRTDFPAVICYGPYAERAEKQLRKGMWVAVQGALRTRTFEKRNGGGKVYVTEVSASNVTILTYADKEELPEGGPTAFDLTGQPDWSYQMTLEGFEPADDVDF